MSDDMSDVSICNLALSRLAHAARIQNLEEDSAEAIACNATYAFSRDFVLRSAPWPFATKRQELTEASAQVEVPAEWAYAYTYPPEALRFLRIEEGLQNPRPEQRIPFRIEHDQVKDGRIVFTNMRDAVGIFIKKVTRPGVFTSGFTDALAWRVAAEIAMAVTGQVKLRDDARMAFIAAFTAGLASDLNESEAFPEPESHLIASRTGDVWGHYNGIPADLHWQS